MHCLVFINSTAKRENSKNQLKRFTFETEREIGGCWGYVMALTESEAVGLIYVLPEECIAGVLSFTSPPDACRSSSVSTNFRSAAESDAVWESFLPPQYKSIISRSAEFVVFALFFFEEGALPPSLRSSPPHRRGHEGNFNTPTPPPKLISHYLNIMHI
jgi:hypothetical protein